MTYVPVGERTTFFYTLLAFLINIAISIVKNTWRAKKEVGKKVRESNPIRQKQKTGNHNKRTVRALLRR